MAPQAPEYDDVYHAISDDETSCMSCDDSIDSSVMVPLSPVTDKDFKKTRHVRINSTVSVADVPHASCYSEQERETIWYSHDDFSAMRESRKDIMDALARTDHSDSSIADDENFTAHGLCTTAEVIRRQRIIRDALLAVLTEQEFQWDEDVEDPELVADVYFQCTSESQWEATDRAMSHAEDVKNIYSESVKEIEALTTPPAPQTKKTANKKTSKSLFEKKLKTSPRRSLGARALSQFPNILSSPRPPTGKKVKATKVRVADILQDALMVVTNTSR